MTPPHIASKCPYYNNIGIGQIFVFDPQKRNAQIWNSERSALQEIEMMALGNGVNIPVPSVWAELDKELA